MTGTTGAGAQGRSADQPPPLTLRPLDEASGHRLQALYDDCGDFFRDTTGRPPGAVQATHDLDAAARDDGRHILGIFLAGEMVGMLDMKLADPGPYDVRLGLLLLTPTFRGQGLGSWALRILEEWLRQATPTEAVVLSVSAADYLAQRFFQSHGYAFTGRATRVPAGGALPRLLFMRKALEQP